MHKTRNTFLLLLVIGVGVLGFLNLESIQATLSSQNTGRLDNEAGLANAKTSLGATLREAKALKVFNNGELSYEEAQSLTNDPRMEFYSPMPDVYYYTYTYKTATEDKTCTLDLSTEAVTC